MVNKRAPVPASSKVKILIADDAQDVALRLKGMLQELEHVEVVGPARNGQEALQLYRDHRPHGLVLDLAMPVFNGLEALRAIREHDRDSLIIMLTNHNCPVTRESCLHAGADCFLHKSNEFERVVEIVADYAKAVGQKQSRGNGEPPLPRASQIT